MFDDNLCEWCCLPILHTKIYKKGVELVSKAAINLRSDFYGDNISEQKDVRPTKLFGFEGIAKQHIINIILYKPNKYNGKDAGFIIVVSLW